MRPKLRALPFLVALLPFDFAVAVGLLAASLFLIRRRGRHKPSPLCDCTRATIIIVNWDGKRLLEECLPSVVEAVRRDGRRHDVIVVDNGSSDGSAEFVRVNFPAVRVLQLDRNYGFSGGNDRAIRQASTDVVVLLNNDMVVDEGFLKPLLDGFSDARVFAVSSQIFFADPSRRREETGKTRGRFEDGFIRLWHDDIGRGEACERSPVFWAGGGSCAIDRRKYLAVGGFDRLYEPFYLEDADLSYQAWKRGWASLLAPASRVVHKHRSTSQTRFGEKFVENTIRRNQFLFVWKNITDPSMTFAHLLNLPKIHFRAIQSRGPAFELRAFFRAFVRLPLALGRRIQSAPAYAASDSEVLERSCKET